MSVSDHPTIYISLFFEALCNKPFISIFASKSLSPEDTLADKELKNILKVALKSLNQREALVTQLYYVEELNVYEIAEVLEISTGRVSQIKKSIVTKLRKMVNEKIT